MENKQEDAKDLLQSQGLTYTRKSKKLEDAKSSSSLFIVFGVVGLILLAALWMGLLPIVMADYMKILYTLVLGTLFIAFIIAGVYYTARIKTLTHETNAEEKQTEDIISYVITTYPLETLDESITTENLSMEQLYFERYEKISAIIQYKYHIQDASYLDYVIDKIFQKYLPEDEVNE